MCHISNLGPHHFQPLLFFPPHPSFFPLLLCIPLYCTIHSICCSCYPGKTSAAARPCDQPRCCPNAFSTPVPAGEKDSWRRPWRQTDYCTPLSAPFLPPTSHFHLTGVSSIFTLLQFFCSFKHMAVFFFFCYPPLLTCFLEGCVDKLTQTPVNFTPGMRRGVSEKDRGGGGCKGES